MPNAPDRRPSRFRRALVWSIERWPGACFAVASLLDRVRPPQAGRGFTRRDRVMMLGLMRGRHPRPFPRLASGSDPGSLRGPLVLTTFHLGAYTAIGAFLRQLRGDVLAIAHRTGAPRPGMEVVEVRGGELHRIAAARKGVQTLREGGFVFLTVDVEGAGSQLEVTLLGRKVSFAGGAFGLARSTQTPILPLMARWRGRKVEIVTGPAIGPGEEPVMAAALAGWLEDYFAEHPEERQSDFALELLGHPDSDSIARSSP